MARRRTRWCGWPSRARSLVVTVDCGALAFEALEAAKAAGLDVIVVDHHKCATSLPVAHAIVNPNRLDEGAGAAHGHLAAVGVAFLLGAALIRTLRARGWFSNRAEPRLLDLLDIVALGTVADVAQLKGLNRAFVTQGLKVMAARRNIGLAALIETARLTRDPTATDLGFALGPRINAGGRVGRADLGVRLLTTEDEAEARAIAAELDHFNEERRAIEQAVREEADARLAGQDNRAVAIIAGAGWHPGVIGIVASRIKERIGRPAIVVALDGGIGKGSGRSVSGVDLGAAVLAAKDAGLLVAGGGHAMAAGLTVEEDRTRCARGFPRRTAGGRRRRRVRQARAVARRGGEPRWHHALAGRGAGGGRSVWRWLAEPACRGRTGARGQGGHCRQGSCPRDRGGGRWPPNQGDGVRAGGHAARRGAARRRPDTPVVDRRPRPDRRLGADAFGRTACG